MMSPAKATNAENIGFKAVMSAFELNSKHTSAVNAYRSRLQEDGPSSELKSGADNPLASLPCLIALRCRPALDDEHDRKTVETSWECVTIGSYGKVVLHKEKDLAGLGTGDVVSRSYDLHKTYGGERETGDIYDDAVEPVLGVAREGHGYVIAYGQTGSGKTHTITGVTRSVVEEEGDNVVGFRYWEVGGRECYDTLDGGKKVAVRTDENGEDVVCGLKEWKVEGKEGLREIVGRAEGLRRTACTTRNGASSRTHAFCEITFSTGGVLVFVDLAGSEGRGDAWGHGGMEEGEERLKEMKEINGSLGDLKECIRLNLKRVKGGGKGHVPYRRSLLTRLLRRGMSGGPSVKTAFIAHVSPLRGSLGMTENTVKYASFMLESSMMEKEKANFKGVETWSGKKVSKWVELMDGGKHKKLAEYMVVSGKQLKNMWRGDVFKRIVAAGGSEADAERIYDRFHEIAKKGAAAKGKVGGGAGKKGGPGEEARKKAGNGDKRGLAYQPMGAACVENS